MDPISAGGLLGLLILLVGMQHLERREWARERRELLDRIQHPQRVPGEPWPGGPGLNRNWSDPREARLARERDLDGA